MKNKQAFTLVELIVVITILAILWTIAFISLQWYSKYARDSVRISDLSNIEKQLELTLVKWSKVPLPDEALILTSSWIIIWYQWYIWEESLNKIWIHGWWKDPLNESYYTYRINWTKTTYQIMWFLEDWVEVSLNMLSQTNAADLTERYPTTKWKRLWILLEQITNKPLNQITTWTVDLRNDTTDVDMYLTTTTKKSWTPKTLYWEMETLALSQDFTEPEECPEWFIPVPWNINFLQTWFCVAKYEMTYSDADTPNTCDWACPVAENITNQTDWNTVSYTWSKIPVSQAWKYPIAKITQSQAIAACESMWDWYHLITNNEWMTIARNIEQQQINWSWGIVWQNHIYNWLSRDFNLWCWWSTESIYTSLPRARATKTWWWFWNNTDCDNKRKLTLSNWEEIWDLSWNLWEHVNWANTLDWSNYNTMQANVCWENGDTEPQCEFTNGYTQNNIWPKIIWLNADNWIWRIYSYKENNNDIDNIFLRSAGANNTKDAGIFMLLTSWDNNTQYSGGGFRCSYN